MVKYAGEVLRSGRSGVRIPTGIRDLMSKTSRRTLELTQPPSLMGISGTLFSVVKLFWHEVDHAPLVTRFRMSGSCTFAPPAMLPEKALCPKGETHSSGEV